VGSRSHYYASKGPASDGIINGSTRFDSAADRAAQRGYLRFAVARVAGTSAFMAVSLQYRGPDTSDCGLQVRLHRSKDLIHWTKGVKVPLLDGCGPGYAKDLFYPILLNAAGTANEAVDPSDFFILGAQSGRPFRARVSVGGLPEARVRPRARTPVLSRAP